MIGGLLVAAALLLANAFFVAVEFALVATRAAKLEPLVEAGDTRARAAVSMMRDLSFALSASQLGVTLASLGLGYVAEPTVAKIIEEPLRLAHVPHGALHPIALVVGLTIVVFFHTVVGEMVPKNLAIAAPETTALWLALPMRAFAIAFRPIVRMLNVLTTFGLRLLRVELTNELVTLASGDELAGMLTASKEEGFLDEVEHRMMTGALGFPQRTVDSVMVPRDGVVAVRAGTPVAAVEAVAARNGHSRLPVYGQDLDEIVGYVHAKDLLALPAEARRLPMPRRTIREVLTARTTDTLQDVLLHMRGTRLHVAAVLEHVDGEDRLAGIVTLEDLLESLVGDIRDEHDRS